ncbi:MFS transporter, SP family, solute carrier family 2, member 2 [Exophiala viscosa]|uniref:MFS transporter, SP family, solute carrier family 2, member 2 n=1 Tax=Exophiala viscosa TaxID=2486360 RepID=UPI0021930CE4|nr:MFS transporter, SP family, solute carrier family 2, member 2 [Exophiala viscosa]
MGLISKLRSWSHELTPYFIYLLFVATLGPLLFGYHLAELNAPQDVITCTKRSTDISTFTSLPQCIPMNSTQIGLVSSIFTLGGLVGALFSGFLAAKYGRLLVMRVNTLLLAVGPIVEALAPNLGLLAVGRLVSGIGAGVSVVVVPIYISEIAPPKERGFFGAFTQIMTNMGIFITQLLGYFLSHGQMWRVILAVAGAIGVLQLLGLLFSVDSPTWQADHGDAREAKANLKRIRGHKADISEEVAVWRMVIVPSRYSSLPLLQKTNMLNAEEQTPLVDEDQTAVQRVKQEAVGIISVLRDSTHNRAILAVVLVMMAQQLCGINSIIMYGVSLLADLLASNSALLNILVSILNVVATTAFAPLADILGRKICILASIAGMGVSSIMLAVGIRSSIPVLSAISVLLFVASFAFGLGPVPFILANELVGPEAVGATQSWALAANWISTFVVAQFFPMVNEQLGKGVVYFIFAGVAAVFWVIVFWYVPETMGKRDADEVWGRNTRRED